MESDNRYHIGRYDKVTENEISESILCTTWFSNNSISTFKPFENDTELENTLKSYLNDKKQNKVLKDRLFNGLAWWAAYLAHFARLKYWNLTNDYQHYLGYALSRLWECLKTYDPSFNCSIYTYVLNDYNFRVRRFTEEMYSPELYKTSLRIRMRSVLNKAIQLNLSFNDLERMDDNEFDEMFCINKKTFILALAAKNVSSLNEFLSLEEGCSVEKQDVMEDPYTSTFADRVCANFDIQEIYDLARDLYSTSERNYNIWKMYVSGDYTLQEIGNKYGMTRERIRQIFKKTNDKLKCNRRVKDIMEQYAE